MKAGWITLALGALLAAVPAPDAAAQTRTTAAAPRHTDADVRFVRMMIGHHQQALDMAALVPTRSQRADLRLLAERIDVSQRDEMATMHRWLQAHGAPAMDAHAGHGGAHASHDGAADSSHADMPGMATPEQMAALAAASGPAFDRMFLELMIRHHEGALQMVAELFASEGGGQEPSIFALANEVDADQRMEIGRMQALLEGPLSPTAPR
ncbi:DUF305 domain-containing protein [Longimicrobium sp.]|uniref:DUF305 domain-containing protein n=1 Tax=Longimicrobium sp. TaxID=2029185 RepID=UPI002E36FE6C|nr:DUF305 domain-containing protein [Longimicrobium sp.]HEX6041325.1 DUF305 domain-containing protein [Longimicrobium sp.]